MYSVGLLSISINVGLVVTAYIW